MSQIGQAKRFFYAQAGYSYPSGSKGTDINKARWQCADRLAKAERWAEQQGLEFVWKEDTDIDLDDWEFEADREHVRQDGARYCLLVRPCAEHGVDCRHAEVLASLSGITESFNNLERDNYRRVVQAELALEAMTEEMAS